MNIFKAICCFIVILFFVVELLSEMRLEKSKKCRTVKIGGAILAIGFVVILLIDEIMNV